MAHNSFYVNYMHKEVVDGYLESVDKAFSIVSTALNSNIADFLECEVAKKGFARLT